MFIIIGIMFGGIILGSFLRCYEWPKYLKSSISYTIYLLLFLLGISVGSNKAVMSGLTVLGWQALSLAVAGTMGSVLAAWFVYHFFFKERRRG